MPKLTPLEHERPPAMTSPETAPRPLTAHRGSPLTGEAAIPGDKSISHRSLMFGALVKGTTTIKGLLEGEDVIATANAMRALGAKITKTQDGTWQVEGIGIGNLTEPDTVLDMGNSGTSTRLLMGLLASHPITTTLTGDSSLTKRPMKRVTDPLSQMGAHFITRKKGRLPLSIQGTQAPKAIRYEVPVPSAQVKSAILLAGLNTPGRTTVIETHPTRDHTENMLRFLGATVTQENLGNGKTAIHIEGHPTLTPQDITVPSDPSSAAFPIIAALITEGSDIICRNIALSPTRSGLYTTLQDMGADLTLTNERTEAEERIADMHARFNGPLNGIDVPAERIASMVDEVPALAMAAACAQGTTRLTGLAELRIKECDRLLVTAEGLKACGVSLEMGEDTLTIHGTGTPPQGGAQIKTHLDHRIAMSFLVLGTVTQDPITADDGTPIQTSFPNFLPLMTALGAKISAP